MNIGFDLDKVFINHPPLVPSWIISKLYGEKSNGHLSYRVPGKMEQQIRKFTHASFLRPAIQSNILLLRQMQKNTNQKFFLISSRFGFLEKETENILAKYDLKKLFSGVYFNFRNEQPHIFKDAMLRKTRIDRYVDDDLPLLRYLSSRHPHITFFWLNSKRVASLRKNLYATTKLSSVFSKL